MGGSVKASDSAARAARPGNPHKFLISHFMLSLIEKGQDHPGPGGLPAQGKGGARGRRPSVEARRTGECRFV
jgi:hypothetical protein